jgi:hypothetical protein
VFWQIVLGVPLAVALFVLAVRSARARDRDTEAAGARAMRRCVVAYAVVAVLLAVAEWMPLPRAWMLLHWTAVHPMMLVFAGAGAFLVDSGPREGGSSRRTSGLAAPGALLLAFALVPPLLLSLAPKPDAATRNVGRPVAGMVEVARYGLGGPPPAMLQPENEAGERRGMGFLPREVTASVGSFAAASTMWLFLCAIAAYGRWRRRFLLLAPFATVPLLFLPMPFGVGEGPLWTSQPFFVRAFGPLLLLALGAAGVVAWLGLRGGRDRGDRARPAPDRTGRAPLAR